MKLLTTFKAICKAEKINWNNMEAIYNKLPAMERDEAINNAILNIIIRYLNKVDNNGKPWKPDYNNMSEPKYRIWFRVIADNKHPSGVGLSYYGYYFGS